MAKREAKNESDRQKAADQKEKVLRTISVGVDFGTKTLHHVNFADCVPGTTHTGASYLPNNDNGAPVTIQKWGKGSKNALILKTPTIIAYAHENETQKEKIAIGTNVKPGSTSYSWWKLGLDSETNAADYDDPLLEKAVGSQITGLPAGKTAEQVTTDYLRLIYDHIINHLRGVLGEAALAITPLQFCVTVPAAWGWAGRQATLSAAKKAGFGTRPSDGIICADEPVSGTWTSLPYLTTRADHVKSSNVP